MYPENETGDTPIILDIPAPPRESQPQSQPQPSQEPPQVSPRRRLQELLAIPDNQRSEAEWEELNELEIRLAPGNRLDAPLPGQGQKRNGPPHGGQNRGQGHYAAAGAGGAQVKKPFNKKFRKKPKPAPV
jgi:hypothetical protein